MLATTSKRISQETLNQITEAANERIEFILEQLGFDVNSFYGSGGELRCRCLIHSGDNNTAFSYSTVFKKWRCYTNSCHDGCDNIFGLVQKALSLQNDKEIGFRDAVSWLAKILEIKIDLNSNIEISEDTKEISKLVSYSKYKTKQVNKQNTEFKQFPLSAIKDKVEPSWYFINQGFSPEILKKYCVGYCEDPYKPMNLRSYAPVLDDTGTMVIGVTGRIKFEKCELCGDFHNPDDLCPSDDRMTRSYSKWMHYGFSKSTVLYNSWFAEEHIKRTKVAILTEGPKEIWWLEQYGVHNAVCIFGLSFSNIHLKKLIKMGVTTIVVALDNDEKGLKAIDDIYDNFGNYFKIVNIKNILGPDQDIDDLKEDEMNNKLIPFLKSLEKN
jgi:hypothetical protein